MIQVYPSNLRYSVDLGWLRSHLSFSFGEYFDEKNTGFSVMRVCNDDEVIGGKGFGPHPHSDMEIVTVVLRGAIKHEDNLGNIEVTSAGEVQRMSAGSVCSSFLQTKSAHRRRRWRLWVLHQQTGCSLRHTHGHRG